MTTHSSAADLVRLVKANDMDDNQIRALWVPYSDKQSIPISFFRPSSPMATIILGGKGSGKTHLLRYLAFPVQAMRRTDNENLQSLCNHDGYLGIYTRAGSLNSGRFLGRGLTPEGWRRTFAYYIDLWLGQRFLDVLLSGHSRIAAIHVRERQIVERCVDCFHPGAIRSVRSLPDLVAELRRLQYELDNQVKELAFAREFHPRIGCPPGRVVFGFPQAVCAEVDFMTNILISYHMDEYEDFDSDQQRYFNTLVRQREAPVTFRIGARAYGMRTFLTYSADEELQEGSEYESLHLDGLLRQDRNAYNRFAKKLLGTRILDWAGPNGADQIEQEFRATSIKKRANFAPGMRLHERPTVECPHFSRLHKHLLQVMDKRDTDETVNLLRYPDSPLIEKAAVYSLYQDFAQGRNDLLAAAQTIHTQLDTATDDPDNPLYEIYRHFADDFQAQLLRESRTRPRAPTELNHLILISEGLPRVFLTIMKHIFQWAEFESGQLSVGDISAAAQRRGLLDAARWFRDDIPQAGVARERIRLAILRLGELFRMNRYADKPFECSLIGFSTPNGGYSDLAAETIQQSVYRSFLVQLSSGEKDRNSSQVRYKYQLNRLLCPLFELPISRRGTARFNARVTDAIFGTTDHDAFNEVVRDWNKRLYWPFGRSTADSKRDLSTSQGHLF